MAVLALLADGHMLEHVLHVGTVGQRAWRYGDRCSRHAVVELLLLQLLLTPLTLVSVQHQHELLLYQTTLLTGRRQRR